MKTRLYTVALALFFTLTLPEMGLAHPASSQDASPLLSVDHPNEERVQRQMTHLLTSGTPAERGRALHRILEFKRTNAFSTRFFHAVAPAIGALATASDSETLRLMAVSTLYTLDTPTAIAHLRDVARDLPEGHVREVAERVLKQHRINESIREEQARIERIRWGF